MTELLHVHSLNSNTLSCTLHILIFYKTNDMLKYDDKTNIPHLSKVSADWALRCKVAKHRHSLMRPTLLQICKSSQSPTWKCFSHKEANSYLEAWTITTQCVGRDWKCFSFSEANSYFEAWTEAALWCVCVWQYFAGLCGSLFIVFGVIGAGLLGLFVDKTKMFTEVTKVNMALSALACIAFAVVSLFSLCIKGPMPFKSHFSYCLFKGQNEFVLQYLQNAAKRCVRLSITIHPP